MLIYKTQQQPFEDIDEIYTHKCGEVLSFFISKLQPYYSSSRFTLLLTFLDTPEDFIKSTENSAHLVPLPARLEEKDVRGLIKSLGCVPTRNIFQDFLESGHPLALNGQRHATAALACLKIIFKLYHYQAPLSHLEWFGQHYRHPRVAQKHLSHQRHTVHPAGMGWNQFSSFMIDISIPSHMKKRKGQGLWVSNSHLRNHRMTCVSIHIPYGRLVHYSEMGRLIFYGHLILVNHYQKLRSRHLQSILQKSAYSDDLLDFARHRVFRFGYLQRRHPPYIRKTIFALAQYIHRVTGRTAELRLCESLWGRSK